MASQTITSLETAPIVPVNTDSAEKLLSELTTTNTKPLWAQMNRLNPPAPNPKTVPFIWRYDDIRPYLLRAGELITEKQAERRVLMLVNPARGKLMLMPLLYY
jgi:gentisate 1,2-dioxygenase